jgi:predicted dehydrogenase
MNSSRDPSLSRRRFLGASAAAGFWAVGFRQERSPNARLHVGVIGVGGMRGEANAAGCAGEAIVALCDVDARNLEKAAARFPKAARYADFREMLEKEKSLDAVVISTPDHVHAPAAAMAMRLGKHVYCEKPLAHSVFEARTLARLAAERKVATQMGTQIHAEENYRRVVERVRAGAIGEVSEVHVWVGGAWTAQGLPAHATPPACPPHLAWDLWLGPAEERPYSPRYHPAGWRSYWNFGGGHLADMGCHYIDLAFWALELRGPRAVEAEGPPVDEHGAPPWLIVRWDFPARGERPPVKLFWYHGGRKPPAAEDGTMGDWKGNGVLFVGRRGMLVADYSRHKLLPEERFQDHEPPPRSIPSSPGHHAEWIAACKGGPRALCALDYAGPLTEAVLLGNVAYRSGKRLEWDAENLRIPNAPEAERFLRREYRKGWTL